MDEHKEEQFEENLEVTEETIEEIVDEVTEDVETVVVEEVEVMDEAANLMNKLTQQAADNLDKYQRTMAEFDNFRKRTAKEKASMYDDGIRNTIEKLLMVIDNLERAVLAQQDKASEDDAFFKGVNMTLKQFQEVLAGLGVEAIPAVGEQFDPNLHAAVAHEDDDQYGENEIVLEMLKGYQYKGKVIRHSMVKVAN